MQLLFIAAPPQTDVAQQTVFAVRLRFNPVSTFVAQHSETYAEFDQLLPVMEVDLLAGEGGNHIGIGDENRSRRLTIRSAWPICSCPINTIRF